MIVINHTTSIIIIYIFTKFIFPQSFQSTMHNRPTRKVAAAPSLYNILARSIKQNVCVCRAKLSPQRSADDEDFQAQSSKSKTMR